MEEPRNLNCSASMSIHARQSAQIDHVNDSILSSNAYTKIKRTVSK